MTEAEAIRFANEQLAKHGLADWTFIIRPGVLGRKSSCAGVTMHRWKTISMRTRDILTMTEYEIKIVILHEIAHALTPQDPGHGAKWKAKAREFGVPDNPTILPTEIYKIVKDIRRSKCGSH